MRFKSISVVSLAAAALSLALLPSPARARQEQGKPSPQSETPAATPTSAPSVTPTGAPPATPTSVTPTSATPAGASAASSSDAVGVTNVNSSAVPTTAALLAPAQNAGAQDAAAAPAPRARKTSIAAPPEKAAPVGIPRFEGAPVIDGKLDDAVWKHAVVLKDFYQISPGDNTAPTAPTEVLMGYDSRHLYVAFRAFDDPAKVRASVARRDNVFGEDNVRIFLDTFNDRRKAYVLGFNPLGVQQDGIHSEGGGVDYSVDIVMESKGALTADGYVVEVAIPFKSLRYEAGKDKVWGFHAWRNIDRNSDEVDSWMPISRDISGTLNQAGKITGLEGISTERTVELIPSMTLSQTSRRVRSLPPAPSPDPGRLVNEPLTLDPGLTAKFGISPTMTLDLALNPDFAQVEADQLVVTANQRFPIFFPERRPFFLEGIEIFQTPLTAVHTRAIVDPDAAVKLTGRRGRNTYGVMLASDNGPGNIINDDRLNPNNRHLLDQNASIGVARLKRDVGRENSLGLLVTSYNFTQKRNQLASVDGRFKFDPQTTLQFQLIGTHSRNFFRDPAFDTAGCAGRGIDNNFELGRCRSQELYGTGNGMAYVAYLTRQGRNWYGELYGEGFTKNYRADVGFTSRTDTNFDFYNVGYNSTPKPAARLISWHAHNFTHIDYDFRGRMQIWESEFNWQGNFPLNSFFGLAYEYAYERLFEEEFGPVRLGAREGGAGGALLPARAGAFAGDDDERSSSKHHYFVRGGIRPSKKYGVNFSYVYRDGHFDLDFGSGRRYPRVSPAALLNPNAPLDPGPGGLTQFSLNATWQPTGALNNTLSYTHNDLRRYDTNRTAFDVNLLSLRSTYQFTRFLFARARVDYESLPRRARAQFLFGWTPNPGTAIYAGYNDDAQFNGFNPILRDFQPGFRRDGRTFFIKMSYLIRRSFGG